tara:strand:- start:257 stop:907 length:651 start_codon:yes stop_codon:yes gene_type:complete
MSKIKAIIFDYDGVIAESNKVKSDAYEKMYSKYGTDVVKKVMNHHKNNGGISRFKKFKLYHKMFLSDEISDTKLNKLCEDYSKIVVSGVINSPYVDGVYNFISNNFEKYSFFISTGTPTNEIIEILEKKNIKVFFKEIYGSPDEKKFHVSEILKKFNFKRNEVIFVGDAISDRDAARLNKIKFIGRYTESEEIKNEKFIIKDFLNFDKFLNNMNKI